MVSLEELLVMRLMNTSEPDSISTFLKLGPRCDDRSRMYDCSTASQCLHCIDKSAGLRNENRC